MKIKAFGRTALGISAMALLAGGLLAASSLPAAAQSRGTEVSVVPGKPNLMLATYDLGQVGYDLSEAFVSGTAAAYGLSGPASADGAWTAVKAGSAPFKTRVVVARPSDPAKFNGSVVVEWLNVSAGQDGGADWLIAHRELIRKGYAWVGVSAQKVGVEGGGGVMAPGIGLKQADAARYGTLSHPGDAYSYDIYSQVGAAVKANAGKLLGPLTPRRTIAIGESQSAVFLTTYVNAVDPLVRVYDGFFVHSRFGSAAPIDGNRIGGAPGAVPANVRFRADLRVPVLSVITETDLFGARLGGYLGARRPDGRLLRVWEIAGAAHADNYMFAGGLADSGKLPNAALAKFFVPSKQTPMGLEDIALNPGMPHHYVTQAGLAALDTWLRSGRPPASAPLLEVTTTGTAPSAVRDAQGIARGGIRTPWTDVPTIRLSGVGNPKSFLGMLAGSGTQLTKAELAALYPGGKTEYLRKFASALDAAIRAGHVLRDDRQEILEIAAINYDTAPQ